MARPLDCPNTPAFRAKRVAGSREIPAPHCAPVGIVRLRVDRSNRLFAGSLRAGQRAAAIMSLIQSAKLSAIANVSLIRSSSRRGHRNYRPVTPNRGWPVKHASAQTLQRLSDLLDQIRQRQGLKEKKLGIFYRKSKSFLHFHEDPAGTFADLAVGETFDRYPVNTAKERKELLATIDRALAG